MILRPLFSRSTYLGWVWLLLGGAVLMPYMMAGEVAKISFIGDANLDRPILAIDVAVYAAVLPVAVLTGLVLPIKDLSRITARSLLGASIPESTGPRSWERRIRDALWFGLHLGAGGLLSGITLALVPFALLTAALPFTTVSAQLAEPWLSIGWQIWWGPILAPLMLVALIYLTAGSCAVLRRVASRLLGPTAAERLAHSQVQARKLAARNRIARELHDSVGHALSVITVQAAAAGAVIESDRDFARQAMSTVEETARQALEELDEVIGLLREDGPVSTAPARGLADVPLLLRTCGVEVAADLDDDLSSVPGVISREAYRITQESLTNALRYGADGTAHLRIAREGAALHIEVDNPIRPDAGRGRSGRGVTGMSERAVILGGELTAGPLDGRWRVEAVLPLRSQS